MKGNTALMSRLSGTQLFCIILVGLSVAGSVLVAFAKRNTPRSHDEWKDPDVD